MPFPLRRSILALVSCVVTIVVPVRAQLPEKFTNLRVLPKDISQRPLIDLMKSFTLSLDVRCEFCHVGEGNDLSAFDFASDTKPTKLTARRMLSMLAVVNEQLVPVGEPAPPGTPKVTCFTCHRGARKPLTTPPGLGLAAAMRAPRRQSVFDMRVAPLRAPPRSRARF